jgi:hypothetical protein
MGYRNKESERIKEQKAECSKKKREREWEKESSQALWKGAREGKLLKGVPLPPNIPHTYTSWSNLYDLLHLVIQVFDLAIYSIQVSYAFTPTLSST